MLPGLWRTSETSPELTPRAIGLGLLIGCLLCFTNLYFGLQTGWISMMSLQSALLGYLLSRLIPHLSPLTIQENVVVQTTAVATGTMPLAAGFVGIIPALGLLDEKRDGQPAIHLSWLGAVGWSCAIAYFGVFLAAPLRKQVIIKEKLVFPSGTATAQLISVMHRAPSPGKGSDRINNTPDGYTHVHTEEDPPALERAEPTPPLKNGWKLLSWSFISSASITILAYFFPILFSIPFLGRYAASQWMWTFSPSLSYVGQGIIMGFPTTASMNIGMIVGWAILGPLAKSQGWAPGPVSSMTDGARGWIMWPALAIMCTESIVSLYPFVWSAMRKVASGDSISDDEEEPETEERLVPTRWVMVGVSLSMTVGTVLVWTIFGSAGIKPWATVLAFCIGSLLALLGVRALGETDLMPVSGLSKIAQLAFAFLQPGSVVANIVAGGVAEAGAQQAGDLMQDLKTGHLLEASPRAQFYGQVIGSSLSIIVTATAYRLYERAYTIPSPAFPAPTAYLWLNLARLLRDGSLPPESPQFMLAFGLAGAVLALLKIRKGWKWLPSGIAFAIGFINSPNFSMARLVGGVLEMIYARRRSPERDPDGVAIIIVASGFVLGEGVMSIVGLVLKTFGVAGSCWGCAGGICPTCPP